MASLIYNSALEDEAKGAIDYDSDTFKALLVSSSYMPSKSEHTRRSDVTNELSAGNGYTTGGVTVACTVAKDNTSNRVTLTFAGPTWTSFTGNVQGMVVYKSTGTAANDPLVFYLDTGGVTRTNATLAISVSTITKQN